MPSRFSSSSSHQGSGGLAQTLMQHDLIDEYRLLTYPVVLGTGKRLFADGAKPAALNVIDHTSTGTGVSIDVYTLAGKPTYGAVGAEIDEQQSPDG
jgi:dihydrofolate reductase